MLLKENNVKMYVDHCHWDGSYIGLEFKNGKSVKITRSAQNEK